MGRTMSLAALAMPAALLTALPAAAATPGGESQTGLYVGVHGGYATGSKDWAGPPNPNPVPPLVSANTADHSANGFVIGGTIGGRLQSGSMVLGLEAEASWTDLSDDSASTSFAGFANETEVDWTASLTAQLGINAGSIVPYIEAGVAFAHDRYSIVDGNGVAPDESDSVSNTRAGFVFGAGVDVQIGGGWAARGEYNYMRFGRKEYAIAGDVWAIDQTMHSFRFGILYRFGAR